MSKRRKPKPSMVEWAKAAPPADPEAIRALKSENSTLRKRLTAHGAQAELVMEAVTNALADYTPPRLPKPVRSRGREEEIAVAHLSDTQIGKVALALDTPIPTPDGWTAMGDLRDGDTVFDDLGHPTRVVKAHPVLLGRPCYEVDFGSEAIVADAGHLWAVSRAGHSRHSEEVLTTEQIKERLDAHAQGIRVRVAGALDLPDADLPIPPYALGAWLGDGASAAQDVCFLESDSEIIEQIRGEGLNASLSTPRPGMVRASLSFGWQHRECRRGHALEGNRTAWSQCRPCMTERARASRCAVAVLEPPRKTLGMVMTDLGLRSKHIPQEYLRASEEQRRSLLQGIMDTDGHATSRGACEIVSAYPRLARGIYELVASLGMKPSIGDKAIDGKRYERITFRPYGSVFRLRRKQQRVDSAPSREAQAQRARLRRIVAIRPVESVPVRCITVDSPSRLYLAGRAMIPTHNTKSYDTEIACGRIAEFGERVCTIIDRHRAYAKVNEVHLYLGGDMVEGELIFPGQAHLIDQSVFDQAVVAGPGAVCRLILRLLQSVRKVRVVCVCGNHGRPASKHAGSHPRSNWDRVFYHVAKALTSGADGREHADTRGRVEWVIADDFYAVNDVLGHKHLVVHGDQIRGGFGGFPWYGAARKAQGWIDAIPEEWTDLYFGHFHTYTGGTLNLRRWWCNGSTESGNEFAQEQLAACGTPVQRLQMWNHEHGMVADRPIYLTYGL